MTPSEASEHRTLFIESANAQCMVILGVTPTGEVNIEQVYDAITGAQIDTEIDIEVIMNAIEIEQWAFDNDEDVMRPVTCLFIEEGNRRYEVVVGMTNNNELVPVAIRDAITLCEVAEEDLPEGPRFTEAIRMWQWSVNHDPDNIDDRQMNINFIEKEGGDG